MGSNPGYMGKMLRVNLTDGKLSEEVPDKALLRKYMGGTGIGMYYLYKEVPPGVEWNSPENRMVFASGPLGGTRVGGSGGFSLVTKGCMTNGASSCQANGYLGAFLKFCGYDGIIIQGAAPKLSYLYIHDGVAELKDASHLAGKDTWETEDAIKKEVGKGKHQCSVYGIGPAGENLVRFACVAGDNGHVAAHNGVGAVMGSKRLKAIAVARDKQAIELADKEQLTALAKELYETIAGNPKAKAYRNSVVGTAGDVPTCMGRLGSAILPVKNYTTNYFPGYEAFAWENFGKFFEVKEGPCWGCRFHHCHVMKVKEGKHAGYIGEEPEYEQLAAWGSLIGNHDFVEAFFLSNEVDRLGIDTNESGWLIAWLMECTEKGLLTTKDTDGLNMRWGDTDAALAMLKKVANREGVGNTLAEGVMRATEKFSLPARSLAIYTYKGNTPRGHDHRSVWAMMLDTCISDTGSDVAGSSVARPQEVGLPGNSDTFTPEVAAKLVAGTVFKMPLDDCLMMCRFQNKGVDTTFLTKMVNAATGFGYNEQEMVDIGTRSVNLMRLFNVRHGLTVDLEKPSQRYSSAPIDGPYQSKTIAPVWRETLEHFYRMMGWDINSGRPFPETIKKLGLEELA